MLVKPARRTITNKSGNKQQGRAQTRTIRGSREGYSKPFMPLLENVSKKAIQFTDPFEYGDTEQLASRQVIQPPYPFTLLSNAARSNSALNQAVEAYVVNIESYGYQLEFTGPVGKEHLPRYQAEKAKAVDLLEHPTGDKSLRRIREDRRRDLEYLGMGYIEVGRDMAGRITWLEHIQSITMRKTSKDLEPTEYTMPVRLSDGTITTKTWYKYFRRYVQMGRHGKFIYFKEFGDPRPIDPNTGNVNYDLPIEEQATEVYCDELYTPGTRYGLPRWLGALPDILGLRESEIVNLNFFRENAIPAMAVLISGGALTEESYDKVVNVINQAKGQDAMHRILILEAASDDTTGDLSGTAPPAPRIELKPLTERQADGLFKEYQDAGKKKIRSTMRLPALFTGDTEEYTKATSQSGIRVAETQIFAPERSRWDDFVNRYILPTLGVSNWRFRSLGPSVYDPDTLSTMVDRFGRGGAMTPNIMIKIANQVLDVQIPPVEDDWGNIPFGYTLDMVAAGKQVKGFEDTFVAIQDAAMTADTTAAPGKDTPASANDNQQAKVKSLIRRSLVDMTDDIFAKISEALVLEAA